VIYQITALSQDLLKAIVETALNGEMDEHLGYEKQDPVGHHSGNSRNGYYPKTLKSSHGEVEVSVPRDRSGDFEPQFIEKGRTRLTQFDGQILAGYARDLAQTFEEMFGARVSHNVISQVGRKCNSGRADPWMNFILWSIWTVFRSKFIRISVSVYVALGVNMDGKKE